MRTPILSIVVPTKNRYKYLKHLINYFCSVKSEELELVIEDNSDNNEEIETFLSSIDDNRVKYFYCPKSLTINQNSDAAILNSAGKFVSFIGDDDGFMPNIMDVVRILEGRKVEMATFAYFDFVWPDCKGTRRWDDFYPYRFYKCSQRVITLNAIDELRKVLRKGGYTLEKMPRVYQGIVSREYLDRVYQKYGSFFPGPSPDMANAVALCLENPKTLYIDYPFVFAGTGQVRVGPNIKGDHQRDFKKLTFLNPDIETNWDKRLPKVWTGQTIYPETILKVLEKANRLDLEKQLNFYKCYTMFLKNHKQDASLLFELLTFTQYFALCYHASVHIAGLLGQRCLSKIKNKRQSIVETKEMPTIIEYIDKLLQVNGPFTTV